MLPLQLFSEWIKPMFDVRFTEQAKIVGKVPEIEPLRLRQLDPDNQLKVKLEPRLFQLIFESEETLNYRHILEKESMYNLFTQFLYCTDCGAGIHCVKRSYGKKYYMCGKYFRHSVYEQSLVDLILSEARSSMGDHVDNDAITKEMRKGGAEGKKKAALKEIASLRKDIERSETRKQAMWLDGDIS